MKTLNYILPDLKKILICLVLITITIILTSCEKDKLPDRPAETEWVKIEPNLPYIALYDTMLKILGSNDCKIQVNGKIVLSEQLTGGNPYYTDYIINAGDSYKVITNEWNNVYRFEKE